MREIEIYQQLHSLGLTFLAPYPPADNSDEPQGRVQVPVRLFDMVRGKPPSPRVGHVLFFFELRSEGMGMVTKLVIQDGPKCQVAQGANPSQRMGHVNLVHKKLYPWLLPSPPRMVQPGNVSTFDATFLSAKGARLLSSGNTGKVAENDGIKAG